MARVFGCARVVFNDALRVRDEAYRAGMELSDSEIQRRVITQARRPSSGPGFARRPAWHWCSRSTTLAAPGATSSTQRHGKRKGRKLGRPRFKSRKDHRQSFRLTRNGFGLEQRPTVCGEGRRGAGALVARAAQRTVDRSRSSGNQMGTSTPASSSTSRHRRCRWWSGRPGWIWGSPGWRRSPTATAARRRGESKAPGAQAAQAGTVGTGEIRRHKGSNNRDKSRRKLAVAHNEVARARRDYHHKQALALVRENQVIHVEDLNIVGMVKNRRLARAISDASWGQFMRIIAEKADRYGRTCTRCRGGWRRARHARDVGVGSTSCHYRSGPGHVRHAEQSTIATTTPPKSFSLPGGQRDKTPAEPSISPRHPGGNGR